MHDTTLSVSRPSLGGALPDTPPFSGSSHRPSSPPPTLPLIQPRCRMRASRCLRRWPNSATPASGHNNWREALSRHVSPSADPSPRSQCRATSYLRAMRGAELSSSRAGCLPVWRALAMRRSRRGAWRHGRPLAAGRSARSQRRITHGLYFSACCYFEFCLELADVLRSPK